MILAPASQEVGEFVLGSCSGSKLKKGRRKSLASWGHSTDFAAPRCVCLQKGSRCPEEADVNEIELGSGLLCQLGNTARPWEQR